MASSGIVTINAWSVDNGSGNSSYWSCGTLPSSTCYNVNNASGFGRGHTQANITFNWAVNDSRLLTVSYGSTSYVNGPWYVCSVNGYHIDVDFSTDRTNWTTIMSSYQNLPAWRDCDNHNAVATIASTLAAGLTPVVMTQSGYLRIRMWTPAACPTCNGVPGVSGGVWPNAFPNDAASVATAVDVYIDVSWTATIHYNANGGSGAPADQTDTVSAETKTFTIPNTVPTKNNARFEGWATSSSATVPQYHAGDSFTVDKNNPMATLYAVWTEYYRVGDVRYNGTYKTTNRSGGKCHIRQNGSWVEMRSIDAGKTSPVDPPNRRRGGAWQNQYRIGEY